MYLEPPAPPANDAYQRTSTYLPFVEVKMIANNLLQIR